MEINRENVLYTMTVGFPCMNKYEILADLELEPTKENLAKLSAVLKDLYDDGTVSVYQRLGDEGKFMGRGYGISEE